MHKPYIYKTSAILILWLVLIQGSSCRAQNNMQSIQFIPKAFHDVKLGFDEHTIHALTPHYPEPHDVMWNEIAINSPKRIIFSPKTVDFAPIIPVCAYSVITSRRGLKFIDQIALLIHIKKTDEDEWFTGEIVEEEDENIVLDDDERDAEERQERIKEAQKYTLEELEDSQAACLAININALEYVNIPLTSGFYDIYLSKSGLESNRMQEEIVFEK